jgi:hypothetical protein
MKIVPRATPGTHAVGCRCLVYSKVLSVLERQHRFDVCGVANGATSNLRCWTNTLVWSGLSGCVCKPFGSVASIFITAQTTCLYGERHILCRSRCPARSKALICGLSLAGTASSNLAGGMNACLLWVLFVARQWSLRRADHSPRGVLPSVVW